MASQLTGLSSMATPQILAELAAAYEERTGCNVAIQSMGGVDAAKKVRGGDPCDIVVLASPVMAKLEAEGHVLAGSRADVARSGIAFAVRAGAPRPDVSDADAVRRAMLDAQRFCYSSGPSGDHLKMLWERWGIADAMSQRALQAPPGVPVGALVARGDADLGVQQFSELLAVPGLRIIDALPSDVQSITVFVAGVSAVSGNADAARAFIGYLASPETGAVKHRHGMQPA